MDEHPTRDLTAGPNADTLDVVAQVAKTHRHQYEEAALAQRRVAHRLLAQAVPDYSQAATACHRALQFTRQAEALDALARDAGLWR